MCSATPRTRGPLSPSPAAALPGTGARNAGLDTLRAAAIALVFMYHYQVFVSGTPSFGWASEIGWTGVDLFFVLSGYLIADQILAGVVRGRPLSAPAFYARRALRTLPVFWVVLAAYFLFPGELGGRTPPPLWRFLTFTQNLGLAPGTAFSHAWSLCIEEQFYLVLPLVVLAGLRLRAGRRQGWVLIGALMALGIGARAWLWQRHGRLADGPMAGYHTAIYYATLCRFDEFLPGVAVALLKNGHPMLWQRIAQRGNALALVGLAASAAMFTALLRWYYIDGHGYGFFMTAFGYTLMAMAFALLVAGAVSPGSWLSRLRVPGAASLALWSYSIYLSHKAIAVLVQRALQPIDTHSPVLMVAVGLASLAGGALLYRCVEAPFMALRRRHVPGLFGPRHGALEPAVTRSA